MDVDIRAENIGRAKIDQPGWGANTMAVQRGAVSADDQAEPEGRKIFVKWTRNLSVSHRHAESIGWIKSKLVYVSTILSDVKNVFHKNHNTHLQKTWKMAKPRPYGTTPSPMALFGHYLAKNHPTKKYAMYRTEIFATSAR